MINTRDNIADIVYNKLLNCKEKISDKWGDNKSFHTKYFYVDDLLPLDLCYEIYNKFPKNIDQYYSRNTLRERKKTTAKLDRFDPLMSSITYCFQNKKIIDLISNITGISDLEADDKLYASGLSLMTIDDFLNPHIDNSHNSERNLYRRLNLLYYVSPEWGISCGGNLSLWNSSIDKNIEIESRFNRLIVMETNINSWHSVSPVLVDKKRCCVSNYYFSGVSPEIYDYFHVTKFAGFPSQIYRNIFLKCDAKLRDIFSKVTKIGRGKKLMADK